jgi:hypothetical protein
MQSRQTIHKITGTDIDQIQFEYSATNSIGWQHQPLNDSPDIYHCTNRFVDFEFEKGINKTQADTCSLISIHWSYSAINRRCQIFKYYSKIHSRSISVNPIFTWRREHSLYIECASHGSLEQHVVDICFGCVTCEARWRSDTEPVKLIRAL